VPGIVSLRAEQQGHETDHSPPFSATINIGGAISPILHMSQYHFIPLDTLKLIYFAHIHSVLSYGIIFWGGASCTGNVFILKRGLLELSRTLVQESLVDIHLRSLK
jgi:hypothetical protein